MPPPPRYPDRTPAPWLQRCRLTAVRKRRSQPEAANTGVFIFPSSCTLHSPGALTKTGVATYSRHTLSKYIDRFLQTLICLLSGDSFIHTRAAGGMNGRSGPRGYLKPSDTATGVSFVFRRGRRDAWLTSTNLAGH